MTRFSFLVKSQFSKKILFIFMIFALFYLNSCSSSFLDISSRITEFQTKIERDLNESTVKLMSEYEKKLKTNLLASLNSSVQQSKIIFPQTPPTENLNVPVVNQVKSFSQTNLQNLVGKWNYNFLGQNIDVNVQEKDQIFMTTAFFNGYKYEATAEIDNHSVSEIKVRGNYYGDPVSITIKPDEGGKMTMIFNEGGNNIPDFVKGIPLVFTKIVD